MSFLGYLKLEWEAEPSCRPFFSGTSSHLGFGKFKLSFLIKHIVRAKSGECESSLSYAVIGITCWRLPMMQWMFLLHSPFFFFFLLTVCLYITLHLTCSYLSLGLFYSICLLSNAVFFCPVFLPSTSTGHNRLLLLPEPDSARGFVKGKVFSISLSPSACSWGVSWLLMFSLCHSRVFYFTM